MLWNYSYYICRGALWTTLIIIAMMAYAYAVNVRRTADDPKKQDYHPLAIILAPVTLPLFLTLALFILFLRALLFAVFLVTFTILLIGLRKPFIFEWWDKIATRIGDPLLKINTYLIRLAFSPWNNRPQNI